MRVALRRTGARRARQRDHGRARRAQPAPLGVPDDARPRHRLRGGHRGRGHGFALVALPATLVLFGRWVFWPKVPRLGSESLAEGRSLWRRVGDAVSRRRRPSWSGRSSLLGVLAARAGRHRARAAHGRPVPAEAGGDRRRRGPREVTSRRAAPTQPSVLTRRPGRGDDALEGVDGVDSVITARPATGGPSSTSCSTAHRTAPRREPPWSGCALRWPISTATATSAGPLRRRSTRATPRHRDRWVIFPVILLLVLASLVLLLRSRGGTGAAGADRARHLRRSARRELVAVPGVFGFSGGGRGDALAGVPVPGGARGRLQHLPGHPGLGGGRSTARATACCAPSRRPAG